VAIVVLVVLMVAVRIVHTTEAVRAPHDASSVCVRDVLFAMEEAVEEAVEDLRNPTPHLYINTMEAFLSTRNPPTLALAQVADR